MRILPALFFLFLSCSLFAQMESRGQTISRFLDGYNAQRASRDWATTAQTDVSFSVGENHLLVALIDGGKTRVELDRLNGDAMDGMFPLRLEQATVVFTNATILFIDHQGDNHLGFTLLDEPQLPVLQDGYITLFPGEGIGRRPSAEQ